MDGTLMGSCGCQGSPCNCFLELAQDASIIFRGSGTLHDPYIMSALNPGYIRPAARSSSTVAQNGNTSAVDTAAIMNTEEFDTDNMVSIGGNPTRITINTKGLYLVGGQVHYLSTVLTTPNYVKIRRNGVTIESVDSETDRVAASTIYVTSHCLVSCLVGDYFELIFNHDTLGAGNYNVDEMNFWALRLGAIR